MVAKVSAESARENGVWRHGLRYLHHHAHPADLRIFDRTGDTPVRSRQQSPIGTNA
jgi:hypothetical protein